MSRDRHCPEVLRRSLAPIRHPRDRAGRITAGPYQKSGFEGRITLAQEQRLTLTRLRLHHQDFAWENVGPLTVVRSAQGQLDLQRFALRNGRQEISARGILNPGGGSKPIYKYATCSSCPWCRLWLLIRVW